jgi:hypothetical protein
MTPARTLSIADDGAAHYPAVLSGDSLAALTAAATRALATGPGRRLNASAAFAPWIERPGVVGSLATGLLGEGARPVRAVLFDKTPQANWAVAWHQDRTIVVRERVEIEGFGPWSTKDGLLHVAPPISVLERMLTVRVHLDPCGAGNAPLKAALGSHRLGYVAASDASARADAHEMAICIANAGDVWVYSTPILHASDRAAAPSRRRVLQIDYAAFDLPAPLAWRGVGES